MWTACLLALCAHAQDEPAPLPPAAPWGGETRGLIAAADDPWITPAERSGLTSTPGYEQTMNWLETLAAAAPELRLVTIGTSDEGRAIRMVLASLEGCASAAELDANGRPTLLAQAGIHAGEIDGKDAGMMLLRDMTVGGKQRELLARANFLFVPILNVDGHERISPYGRINQRGPARMGWRTDARNLNLNRDYAKLDTAGVRAVVEVLNRYDPELYFDLHVTDGIDYQYDITFGFVGPHGHSPGSSAWLRDVLTPACDAALATAGHVPGRLIFAQDETNPSKGLIDYTGSPRFSNSYGDLRHTPTVLVENHSLKPYDQRVLGTYVMLAASLRVLGEQSSGLRKAIAADRSTRRAELPATWGPGTRENVAFKGIAYELEPSVLSGGTRVVWSGEPVEVELPLLHFNAPVTLVKRPTAYWIPPAYSDVIERLRAHGIRLERINGARQVPVEMLRLGAPVLGTLPFEGRVSVTATAKPEQHVRTFAPGSVRVPTDQPLGDLAVMLLEPAAPDSFFQWGFFLACLQRTEYVEGYVMEPLAARLLAEDPELAAEFELALEQDAALAADPQARLEWLYRRTPWHDAEYGLYPVAREL